MINAQPSLEETSESYKTIARKGMYMFSQGRAKISWNRQKKQINTLNRHNHNHDVYSMLLQFINTNATQHGVTMK